MSRRVAFLWGSNANTNYPTLKYAKQDVARMRGTLGSPRYGFEVITPPDDSTPHQVHEALLEATSSCTADDVFVGYFSGHGQLVRSRLYLVLDRSVPGQTKTLFSSAWLIDALQSCPARHRLLILDCCHAGAATGDKDAGVEVDALLPKERILYASDKLEAARELKELEGSFLTHELCKLLTGAPGGKVPLSQLVDALQRAANERNEHASLQQRVPVPYLSGEQRDEFYFAGREEPIRPRFDSDEAPSSMRWLRRSRLRRSLSSVWLGLRSAASNGQGFYFFTMLCFGLAAFFFHDSLQIQHDAREYLQQNITQAQDQLGAARYPTFETLLLPTDTELCRAPVFTSILYRQLEPVFVRLLESKDGENLSKAMLSSLNRSLWISSNIEDSYQVTSLYSRSPDRMVTADNLPATFNPLVDEWSDPSNGRRSEQLLCDIKPSRDDIKLLRDVTVTSTSPYFDLTGSGIIETICYQRKKQTGDTGTPTRYCADVALPKEPIFARLRRAHPALDISTIHVPVAKKCLDQPQSCVDSDESSLPGTPHADYYKIAEDLYKNFIADRERSHPAAGASGVWPVPSVGLGAVVYHQSAPDAGYIVLARIRDIHGPSIPSISLSALGLITAVVLLVVGTRRKLRRQQSLHVRGLPYGLLELKDGKIVGANDRATEILREKLPRFGIPFARSQSGQTFVTFAPMIHDTCVLLPSHGATPSDADICSYDGKIRDRATDGMTSVFYAWVKRTRMWIKVTSTVILLPNDTEHVSCVLDTAIDALYKDLLTATRARSTIPDGDEPDR